MTVEELLGHRMPLALVAALVLQGGAIVWWAASRDSDLHFQAERLTHVEEAGAETKEAQSQMLQRLARIEERLNALGVTLDRMERDMRKSRP